MTPQDQARRMAEEVELPEPDGYIAMSPSGSIIVPPREFAKHNAYAVFTAGQVREAIAAALVKLTQEQEPVGWLLSGGGYATVFLEQIEPPSPLTREEALSKGWRMVFDHPTPSQQEDEIDYKSLALEQAATVAKMTNINMPREVVEQVLAALETCTTEEGPEQHELNSARATAEQLRAALSAAAEPVKVASCELGQEECSRRCGTPNICCDNYIEPLPVLLASPSPAPAVPDQGDTHHWPQQGDQTWLAGPDAVKPEPCQNTTMGEHACKNRHQCWEPCGELGHSEEHARPAPKETQDAVNAALGLAAKPEQQTWEEACEASRQNFLAVAARIDDPSWEETDPEIRALAEKAVQQSEAAKPETQGEREKMIARIAVKAAQAGWISVSEAAALLSEGPAPEQKPCTYPECKCPTETPCLQGRDGAAKQQKGTDRWICLLCRSSRPGHHTTLEDGVTRCPNWGKR